MSTKTQSVSQSALTIAMVFMAFPTASETFAKRDVRALRQLGNSVTTYSLLKTADKSIVCWANELVSGVFARPGLRRVLALAIGILFSKGWSVRQKLKTLVMLIPAARVAKQLVSQKPDIVHLFWGHYPALVSLLAQPFLPATKFSIFLGAYDLELRLPVSRWAARAGDCVFTHAHTNVEALESLIGACDVAVVHRGIELEAYPAPHALDFAQRPLRIFTAGRLIPEKGFDKVIRSFEVILTRYPSARLVIAGTGPDQPRLLAYCERLGVSQQVDFVGWLSEVQVRDHLLQSRVFMLLSSKPGERLPNALKEAMAAGCVCVTSPSPGIDELVSHGIDGFIYEPEGRDKILEAVSFGFSSDGAQSMSQSAAEKIRAGFDVSVSALNYERLWRDVMRMRKDM